MHGKLRILRKTGLAILCACAVLVNDAVMAAEPLRLAHQFRAVSSPGQAASELAAAMADSGLAIRVVPDGVLGDAPTNLRQIATDELDLTIGGSLAIGYLASEYRSLLIPFLVDRPEDMLAILQGPIGAEMTAGWPARYNLVVLGWFYASPRVIAAVRPVAGPGDLKGLKLRVGGEDTWIDFFQRAGAHVTVRLPLEIDAAARTGLIEAADLPVEAIINNPYGRAFRHVAWTAHHYETMFIGVSASRLAGLEPGQRQALERQTAAITARISQRGIAAEADYRTRLAGIGATVTTFDAASLRPQVAAVAAALAGPQGQALVARIRAQLGR